MNSAIRFSIRRILFLFVLIGSLALASSAFARGGHGHTSFGISIGGPGYGVSYSGCRHCGGGWWNGYVNSGWGYPRYGGHHYYSGGYGGGYYGGSPAAYYDSYYPGDATVVYERPVVNRVYRVRHVDRYADDSYDDEDDDEPVSHRDRYVDDDYEHLDRDYSR
ncbi:MAG: hypothetical protein ABI411_09825 [Tahibacter sp.]